MKSFMKKKVATKSRQTTSSISHVQHLLPRMLATCALSRSLFSSSFAWLRSTTVSVRDRIRVRVS